MLFKVPSLTESPSLMLRCQLAPPVGVEYTLNQKLDAPLRTQGQMHSQFLREEARKFLSCWIGPCTQLDSPPGIGDGQVSADLSRLREDDCFLTPIHWHVGCR